MHTFVLCFTVLAVDFYFMYEVVFVDIRHMKELFDSVTPSAILFYKM